MTAAQAPGSAGDKAVQTVLGMAAGVGQVGSTTPSRTHPLQAGAPFCNSACTCVESASLDLAVHSRFKVVSAAVGLQDSHLSQGTAVMHHQTRLCVTLSLLLCRR
jgi:hypothetical protein